MNNAYRLSCLLGLVASITPVSGNVLFTASDTFDGVTADRTVDGSGTVNSFDWYSGGVGVADPLGIWRYQDGHLRNRTTTTPPDTGNTTGGSDRAAIAFFTAPGASVGLSPGQTITLSSNFTFDRSAPSGGAKSFYRVAVSAE